MISSISNNNLNTSEAKFYGMIGFYCCIVGWETVGGYGEHKIQRRLYEPGYGPGDRFYKTESIWKFGMFP